MHLGADFPGPAEQSVVEARHDVLTFTSEPLADPLTVFGDVTAHLYASSSAVDTDFVVRLCRVVPDGRSVALADGIVRALWRDACAHDGVFRAGVPRRPPHARNRRGVHRQPVVHRLHVRRRRQDPRPGHVELPPAVGQEPQHGG